VSQQKPACRSGRATFPRPRRAAKIFRPADGGAHVAALLDIAHLHCRPVQSSAAATADDAACLSPSIRSPPTMLAQKMTRHTHYLAITNRPKRPKNAGLLRKIPQQATECSL
jgi:hypothetical protein